jgi:hypothetical protein
MVLRDVNNLCYDSVNATDVRLRIHGPFETWDSTEIYSDPRTKIVDLTL